MLSRNALLAWPSIQPLAQSVEIGSGLHGTLVESIEPVNGVPQRGFKNGVHASRLHRAVAANSPKTAVAVSVVQRHLKIRSAATNEIASQQPSVASGRLIALTPPPCSMLMRSASIAAVNGSA